jgi:hypothetical protein
VLQKTTQKLECRQRHLPVPLLTRFAVPKGHLPVLQPDEAVIRDRRAEHIAALLTLFGFTSAFLATSLPGHRGFQPASPIIASNVAGWVTLFVIGSIVITAGVFWGPGSLYIIFIFSPWLAIVCGVVMLVAYLMRWIVYERHGSAGEPRESDKAESET